MWLGTHNTSTDIGLNKIVLIVFRGNWRFLFQVKKVWLDRAYDSFAIWYCLCLKLFLLRVMLNEHNTLFYSLFLRMFMCWLSSVEGSFLNSDYYYRRQKWLSDSENFRLRVFFSLLFLKGSISQKVCGRKDILYGCWSFCVTYCYD